MKRRGGEVNCVFKVKWVEEANLKGHRHTQCDSSSVALWKGSSMEAAKRWVVAGVSGERGKKRQSPEDVYSRESALYHTVAGMPAIARLPEPGECASPSVSCCELWASGSRDVLWIIVSWVTYCSDIRAHTSIFLLAFTIFVGNTTSVVLY